MRIIAAFKAFVLSAVLLAVLSVAASAHPAHPRIIYDEQDFEALAKVLESGDNQVIDRAIQTNGKVLGKMYAPDGAYPEGPGTKCGFVLDHSTGAKKFERDVPLVYADYYFLEALMRKMKLENAK